MIVTIAALGWTALLGILTLLESRRHDRARLEMEARVVWLEESLDAVHRYFTADIAHLRAEVADMRDWRVPHIRHNHEPAVDRLLAGRTQP